MSAATILFDRISELIPDVKRSRMFGAECLKSPNNKTGVMLYKDSLLIKLTPEKMGALMARPGVTEFDPMGGRPMNGWAQVPYSLHEDWEALAIEAQKYVASLPANASRKKK